MSGDILGLGDVALAFKFGGKQRQNALRGIEFTGVSFILGGNCMISNKFSWGCSLYWPQLYNIKKALDAIADADYFYFQMTHILEDKFMDPQVDIIKEISDHIANLSKMMGQNYGLGEYLFDKEL